MHQHKYVHEPHDKDTGIRLNKLRASVLGANDGIVSIAGLVVGVAGATNNRTTIFTAGVAGVIAGALSMAAGEYVSVSSQRDTERVLLVKERYEIENFPEEEQQELRRIYEEKGLSSKTAALVAHELTHRDAYAAHVDAELAIDPARLVNPWHAAVASALSFFAGALLPLLAITLPPASNRILITFASTIIALTITGALSARFGRAHVPIAVARVIVGGTFAMAITFTIGHFIGQVGL